MAGGRGDQEGVTNIGRMMRERLEVDPKINLCFHVHNEEKAKPGSSSQLKYYV